MLPDRTLRASDDDREQVVSQLGDHLAAGRLQTAEFEERMSAAYDATTLGDLDRITHDLPAVRASDGPSPSVSVEKPGSADPAPVEDGREVPAWRRPYTGWLSVSAMTTAVWGMSSFAADDLLPFWPMWVIGPWGVALLFGMGRGGRGHGFGHGRRSRD